MLQLGQQGHLFGPTVTAGRRQVDLFVPGHQAGHGVDAIDAVEFLHELGVNGGFHEGCVFSDQGFNMMHFIDSLGPSHSASGSRENPTIFG